jgi:hypothetical protein
MMFNNCLIIYWFLRVAAMVVLPGRGAVGRVDFPSGWRIAKLGNLVKPGLVKIGRL